ncbi:MAG: ROK family protein [Verrucomicrobiota bacterium]|jgi:glucokinase|nr:ROK family protein [Verrucomicrobiota bacterium]
MSVRIGIEIGGTKQQIVIGHSDGTIVDRCRFSVDPAGGGSVIRERIAGELPALISKHQPERIGVGFGGPVDIARGTVAVSHQIEGWSGFPLRDWLHDLTALPVTIANDANTAALAEVLCGAGRGFNPSFYMNMGSGVGGGLVIDGKIYHGDAPGEAEVGHLRLDTTGTTVEDRCSGWAVDHAIREAVKTNPDCPLAQLLSEETGGETKYLADALAQDDPIAHGILSSVTRNLAFALSHVVHLFHPQAIILGGGLSLVGVPLRKSIEKQLPQFLMEIYGNGPKIRLAELGEDAVPAGALLLE